MHSATGSWCSTRTNVSPSVTPRDFVVGTMSLFTAAMWAQMSQQYPDAKMPPEINPKNVKLMQDHPEILRKWEEAWSEKKGSGSAADSDDKDE